MRKVLLSIAIASLLACESLRHSVVVDLSGPNPKPKGRNRASRNKQWKANLRVANQRQKGLRNPIGRGK